MVKHKEKVNDFLRVIYGRKSSIIFCPLFSLVQKSFYFLTSFPVPWPCATATFSLPPLSPSHTAHQQHRHFLSLSHPVLKVQRCRRTRIAPLASSPRLFPSLSSASLICLCRARSHRFCRNCHCRCQWRSAMGRSSRACSLIGSPLLLLLLSLGCATAQNAWTWKTLSGKLDSPRFPSLFLDKFHSIMCACDLVWSISCLLCLKFSFFLRANCKTWLCLPGELDR
jgi:hypothetical protein